MSHHSINGLVDDGIDNSIIAEKFLILLEGIAARNNNHYFERLGNHIIFGNDGVNNLVGEGRNHLIANARIVN